MRPAASVGLQIWIVLFIVFFGAEIVHLEAGLRVLAQVLYATPLVAWVILRLRGPWDRLDWTVLGLLVVYGAICFASRDRTESLGTLGLVTAYAGLFLVLRREAWSSLRPHLTSAVAIAMALTLTYNAWLLVDEKLRWIQRFGAAPFEGTTVFPWQSVNAMPVVVLLAIPAVAWMPTGIARKIVAAVVAAAGAIVVPLSLGRAGWLGLAVAAVAFACTAPAVARRLPSRRHRAVVVGAAAAILVAVAVALAPRLTQALADTGRLALWDQGASMTRTQPILGSGPGTYSWARLAHSPSQARYLAVGLIHNTAFQTVVDGGFALLVAVAATLGVWVSVLRVRLSVTTDRLAVAILAGWAASTTLDDFSYLPALTCVVLLTAAFVAPAQRARQGDARPVLRFGPLALLLAAAVLAFPSVAAVDVARWTSQAARTAMVDGDHDAAAALFRSAADRHPEHGGVWLGLGMALSYAGDDAGARDAYLQAIAVSPGDARGYGGAAALSAGEERLRFLERAAALTLGDPQYAVRLGAELAAAGDMDAAATAWADAVTLDPRLLRALPYSSVGIDAREVEGRASAAISAGPRAGRAENDLILWDFQLATDRVASSAGLAWQAVELARHGDLDAAATAARRAIADAPYEARGYEAAAAVAAFGCDASAERDALVREVDARGAYSGSREDPRIAREFVYREVGLAATQPPGVGTGVTFERWPWPLVDRPACD